MKNNKIQNGRRQFEKMYTVYRNKKKEKPKLKKNTSIFDIS